MNFTIIQKSSLFDDATVLENGIKQLFEDGHFVYYKNNAITSPIQEQVLALCEKYSIQINESPTPLYVSDTVLILHIKPNKYEIHDNTVYPIEEYYF